MAIWSIPTCSSVPSFWRWTTAWKAAAAGGSSRPPFSSRHRNSFRGSCTYADASATWLCSSRPFRSIRWHWRTSAVSTRPSSSWCWPPARVRWPTASKCSLRPPSSNSNSVNFKKNFNWILCEKKISSIYRTGPTGTEDRAGGSSSSSKKRCLEPRHILSSLFQLLRFWRVHYQPGDQSCISLEKGSGIAFEEWIRTIDLLTSVDTTSPYSLLHYLPEDQSRIVQTWDIEMECS